MGFFDKMKQMANAVTGGGAKVTMQIGEAEANGTIPVTVTAVVGDGNMDIKAVYVLLRGLETMKIDPARLKGKAGQLGAMSDPSQLAGQAMGQGRLIEHKEESFSGRVDIAGQQTLEGGQTYTFEGQVRLPAGSQGTFVGKHIAHHIQFQGGLDAPGNDPDSGWLDVLI